MAKKEKITTNENFGKAQSESDSHAWKTSSVAELKQVYKEEWAKMFPQ